MAAAKNPFDISTGATTGTPFRSVGSTPARTAQDATGVAPSTAGISATTSGLDPAVGVPEPAGTAAPANDGLVGGQMKQAQGVSAAAPSLWQVYGKNQWGDKFDPNAAGSQAEAEQWMNTEASRYRLYGDQYGNNSIFYKNPALWAAYQANDPEAFAAAWGHPEMTPSAAATTGPAAGSAWAGAAPSAAATAPVAGSATPVPTTPTGGTAPATDSPFRSVGTAPGTTQPPATRPPPGPTDGAGTAPRTNPGGPTTPPVGTAQPPAATTPTPGTTAPGVGATGASNTLTGWEMPGMSTAAPQTTATNWDVTAPQTVQGQLQGILASNSPLLEKARADALIGANARGLLNSSMAQGAAQAAVLDKATQIASQDAQTYAQSGQFNANAQNAMAVSNADRSWDSAKLQYTAKVNDYMAKLDNASKQQLMVLDGQVKANLAAVEAKYKTQMQTSQSSAAIYSEALKSIGAIMSDPNLDGGAKQNLINQQMGAVVAGLQLQAAIGGIQGLDAILASISATYPSVGTAIGNNTGSVWLDNGGVSPGGGGGDGP